MGCPFVLKNSMEEGFGIHSMEIISGSSCHGLATGRTQTLRPHPRLSSQALAALMTRQPSYPDCATTDLYTGAPKAHEVMMDRVWEALPSMDYGYEV